MRSVRALQAQPPEEILIVQAVVELYSFKLHHCAKLNSKRGGLMLRCFRGFQENQGLVTQRETIKMSNEFIEEFNSFLSGEISAVETYDLALQSVASEDTKQALIKCRDCHSARADKLRARVTELGGTPAAGAGVWGPLAAASQNGKNSETDAVSLLEQSEAERLVQYEAQQKIVVSPVLEVLQNDLLPKQHETHLTMSSLLKLLQPVAK
jgi:hypothetical protein